MGPMVMPRRGCARAILLAAALVLSPGLAGPVAAAETTFVIGTEDLPLMPGLRQVPDTGMVFETGQGRIVEAYAVGPVTPDQVRAFYAATLPQLGWRPAADGAGFRREGETLRIEVLPGTPPRTVRFRIAPGP